jgi:hypothetical protein
MKVKVKVTKKDTKDFQKVWGIKICIYTSIDTQMNTHRECTQQI